MKDIHFYIPTRVVFGAGRLDDLSTLPLPGKKALICVTSDGLMEKLGIQQRVITLLQQNHTESVVFDRVMPNPTREGVMAAREVARAAGCDFVIGLGGGSSIDTAKAVAIMMVNPGDLWEYASAGSGGRKQVKGACPIVTISTTAGTGTETDPFAVITNEQTGEKLDFTLDAIFPQIAFIDPDLTLSLPRSLTMYQGFDALFHAAECYVNNRGQNRLLDIFAIEAVATISENLPRVLNDGNDAEARSNVSYVANILSGFTQALGSCTSHHIIAQAIGGLFPQVAHGATLLLIAKAYYQRVQSLLPQEFDAIGAVMGEKIDPANPGGAFLAGLSRLMDATGASDLTMSGQGITHDGLAKVADIAANLVGFECDSYDHPLTEQDALEILEKSWR